MNKFNKNNDIDELLRQLMLEEEANELTEDAWQALEENVLENEPVLTPSSAKEEALINRLSNSNNQSGLSTKSKFTLSIIALIGIGLTAWLTLSKPTTLSEKHEQKRPFESVKTLKTNSTTINTLSIGISTTSVSNTGTTTHVNTIQTANIHHPTRGTYKTLQLPNTSKKLHTTLSTNKYDLLLAKQNKYYATDRIHVHTGKNYLKAGDDLNWALYLRNAANFSQAAISDIAYIELIDPKGKIIIRKRVYAPSGSAYGTIVLPYKLATGKYKLKAFTKWQKENPENYLFEKPIYISGNSKPKLKLTVNYGNTAYSAGEKVNAEIYIAEQNGEPITNQKIKYALIIDHIKMFEEEIVVKKTGKVNIQFKLPEDLKTQNGMLNIAIPFKKAIESFFEPVPIKFKQLQFTMHPESGKLVYGIANRVVFSVNNEFGNPINIEGYLKNSKGNQITTIKSYYNGVGEFGFSPESGEKYTVVITKPIPSTVEYRINNIHQTGQIINAYHLGNDSLQIALRSSDNLNVDLNIKMRNGLVYTKNLDLSTQSKINIPVNNMPAGVATISIVDANSSTLAERMIYINHHKKTEFTSTIVKQNNEHYLSINNPSQALSQVSIALLEDKPSNQLENTTGTHSSLTLQPELINKLSNPGFYFSTHEKSFKTLDLLLMASSNKPPSWKELSLGRLKKSTPEIAMLSGGIYNNTGEMLLPGVEVKIIETKQSLKSSTGSFSFEKVDITKPKTLEIKYEGLTKTIVLQKHFNNLKIKLPEIGFDYTKSNLKEGIICKIVNDRNEQPIPNIEIEAEGVKYISDVNGLFYLQTKENSINLIISGFGYESKKLTVTSENGKDIAIHLKEDLSTLNLESVDVEVEYPPLTIKPIYIKPADEEGFDYEKLKEELLQPTWEFEVMDQLEWVRDAFTNKKYKDNFGNLNVNEHYNVVVEQHQSQNITNSINNNIAIQNNTQTINSINVNDKIIHDNLVYWNSSLTINENGETSVALPLLLNKSTYTLVIEGISSDGTTIRHINTLNINTEGTVTIPKR